MKKTVYKILIIISVILLCNIKIYSQSRIKIDKKIRTLKNVEPQAQYDSLLLIYDNIIVSDTAYYRAKTEELLELTKKFKDKRPYILTIIKYSELHPSQSLKYLLRANKLAIENDFGHLISLSYETLCFYYKDHKMYDKLVATLIKANNFYERTKNIDYLVSNLHINADLFYEAKLYTNARKLYLKILEEKGNLESWNLWRHKTIINNLGLIELELKNYSKAVKYFNESLALIDRNKMNKNDSIFFTYTKQMLSLTYLNSKEYRNALKTFNEVFSIAQKLCLFPELIELYSIRANLFFLEKKYEEALHYINIALQFLEKKGKNFSHLYLKIYKLYAKTYYELAQYEEAYFYQSKYNSFVDSLDKKNTQLEYAQFLLDNSYDKLLTNLANIKKNNYYYVIVILISILSLLIISLIYLKLKKTHKCLLEKERENTDLTRTIIHNLKNPLSTIKTANDFIASNKEEMQTVSEMTDVVKQSSVYMLETLSQILFSSKTEDATFGVQKKRFNFITAVNKVIDGNNVLLKNKNQIVEFDCDKEKQIFINADYEKILIAIENYISNAIKYSPLGSKIKIRINLEPNQIYFGVLDMGPGLDNEEMKKAFGKFVKLTPKPTGSENSTGLGLSIVKTIINLHNGKVGIKSELGKGSEFYFTIPKK